MKKSIGIAYDISKRNKKMMAKGGEVSKENTEADVRETADHSYDIKSIPGQASAGYRISKKHKKTGSEESFDVRGSMQQAKEHVKNMIGAHEKQKLAEGGEIEKRLTRQMNDSTPKGVHRDEQLDNKRQGVSQAGNMARKHDMSSKEGHKDGAFKDSAIAEHKKVLSEMRKMPKPKIQGLAQGGMVESGLKITRLDKYGRPLDHETRAEETIPPMKHEGMSEDKGPSEKETMADHFAEGGMINEEVSMHDSEEDMHKEMMAEGGMIDDMTQPEPEAEEEQHDSIASAIMARRKMMAEGGMVDIEQNGKEQPNSYYHQNEVAALKENYDEDMHDMHQPMDSNEHADPREEDSENKHDMISQIRSKMNMKRQFKGK